MPKYKLSYFPIRGRAEAIRIVFAVAGVEFEDNRVGPKEWFTELKHSGLSPSGQLPVLEVDGKILTQSKVILSYVAKELNLAPEGNFQLAQADMLADVIGDLESMLSEAFNEKDPDSKEKALATASEEAIPAKCGYFEKFLVANSKHGFFIGDKLTYADIVVFTFLNSYFAKGKAQGIPEQLKEYPTLSAWYELVRTQPKVLQWLKNPPAGMVDYIY
ncbi:glutathione S-transferase 1-like [Orbicella faveolata]|uniref:glutathione S-transferase 1-like n=1 Tax=Orbicella faveolata TaxID=48498 RepID=UPI0009E2F0BE|nr:glutathione S-transferase 1-like [Orbicella faveolata]